MKGMLGGITLIGIINIVRVKCLSRVGVRIRSMGMVVVGTIEAIWVL